MYKFVRTVAVVSVLSLLIAGGLSAQTTTGRLAGQIVDSDGGMLPGVTVQVTSDVLIGGAKTTITDAQGGFQFVGLPPGVYSVRADLDGFTSQERTGVKVPLGGTAVIDITMPVGSFESEIEVTGETPVIDPTQVNSEQIFDQAYLKGAAIGSSNRSYQSILTQAAGVAGGSNPNVFGSTLGENAYFIDGMDTTDPVTATFGTNFNFDAIQEIQFQTGGFEAEFGRATGGLVNLVTKSGGNRFSGTFDARYRDSGFQESGDNFDASTQDTKYQRFDATLGGPIMRDRLWFFVSYSDIDSRSTPTGALQTRKFLGQYYLAKGTWQIADSWRTVLKYSGDPADIDNASVSRYRLPEADRFQTQGGDIFSGELNAVLTDALLWNTLVGTYTSNLDSYPMSGDLETIGHYNYDTLIYSANYMNQQYSERTRDEFATSLTWFVDQAAGSHEFKGGVEYSGLGFTSSNCDTGTEGGVECTAGVPGYVFYDVEDGGTQPYFMWEDDEAGAASYDGTLYTAYLQDAWRPTSNLTLKIGARYDTVAFENDLGTEIADMDMVQPRLGVAWDITGDAKNVVRGSWGRFMHPSATTLPSFAKATQETSRRFYSCSYIMPAFFGVSPETCADVAAANGYTHQFDREGWDPYGWFLFPSQVYGSAPNQVVDGLSPTYADELILAYERELWDQSSIEFSYVDKSTKDIFEDTCDGNYPNPSADASCDYYLMANLEGLRRDYTGYIVKFETRHWDWLTLLASYTYSESEGNVEYTQNAGADFDSYPAHYVNTYGYLSDHRDHRFKLNGFVLLPLNFTVGFDFNYSSPFVWAPTAGSGNSEEEYNGQTLPYIPYGTYFVEPRGSREGPDNAYQLDLQVTWGLPIGSTRLEFIGSVFNVFSNEDVTGVCESINCSVLGEPDAWRTPRRYEVGFRFEF